MSEPAAFVPHSPELVTDGIPEPRPGWVKQLTSGDHKDVGRLLIGAALCFAVLALVELVLMRLQLAVPENDMIRPTVFDRLNSVNGATVVFLFALPLAFGLFAYVVPLQIGARGLVFPRLASMSAWLILAGGIVIYSTFLFTPPEAGVNPWPPLSDTTFTSNNGVDAWIAGTGLALLGIVLLAINLITTLRRSRAPGLVWRRMPTFSFAAGVCSGLLIVLGSFMLAAMTMLEIDRHFGGVFFDAGEGGSPTYWQHLSWLFFTGTWLVMLLSAIGAISEILPVFARKPLFNRRAVNGSMVAIAVLGSLAWMQNMFSNPIGIGWMYFAMAMALLLIVPIGLILFNWMATLAGGSISMRAPLLFSLAAISTISIGLAAELCQSVVPVNWLLGGTVDATAATGYIVVGAGVLGGLAALHFWFPKMTGRTMGEPLAGLSLILILIGVNVTFMPLFLAGLDGQPVDVYKYYSESSLNTLNLISTIGSFVLAVGVLLSVINALLSRNSGARAGHDPWGGDTLEWFTTSPPSPHNFDVIPDVRSGEPLRDIREAIEKRSEPAAAEARSGQPVA